MKQNILIFTSIFLSLALSCLTACDNEGNPTLECTPMHVSISDPLDAGDPYDVTDIAIWGDCLILTAHFSGGCAEHSLELHSQGAVIESYPVQANVMLFHHDPDDPCDAFMDQTAAFDLTSLQVPGDSITILNLLFNDTSIEYHY